MVAAAAIPSAASGLWVFWHWLVERGDRHHTEILTREQTLVRELELQRAALGREHADLFDRIRTELVRTHARLIELERDRDRGWDLARWWNQRAHELRHAGLNAQTMVMGLSLRVDEPPPRWPDMVVPALEDPMENT